MLNVNINLLVNKFNLVDLFCVNDFIVISKIYKEIAIFLGGDQDDNECVKF